MRGKAAEAFGWFFAIERMDVWWSCPTNAFANTRMRTHSIGPSLRIRFCSFDAASTGVTRCILAEEPAQTTFKYFKLVALCLALPDRKDLPALAPEFPVISSVALGVALTLGVPIGGVLDWRGAPALTGMHMPETTVNVDDLAKPRQNDVRCSGQVSAMQSKSIPEPMHQSPDDHLGLGVG
jgi:hypothetical protein